MLRVENISKRYRDRNAGQWVDVLRNCSLDIASGEILGLMGESGCGKSTLARIILRLIKEDEGKVFFNNEDITDFSQKELSHFRKSMQFIYQRPESFFDPIYSLKKSLYEPMKVFGMPVDENRIKEMLETVQLGEGILKKYPHQVSGGEIQRLSIARALLLEPKVLILDEPTSMLDVSVQAQVLHLLRNIQEKGNLTYLLISHDKNVVDWMCHRIITMEKGRLQ